MGSAIGLELARRGVGHIVFAQRRAADKAVAAVHAANPAGTCISLTLDISSHEGVATFFAEFSRSFDRLDYLVNVSGACPRTAVADVTEAEMAQTYAVNAAGPFWLCQAARPIMFASGGGAIVNIGSLAGEDGANAASISYTMAKAALRGMMMQLAKLGFPPAAYLPGAPPRSSFPLIRINNISPGPVQSDMLASMAPADLAKIKSATLTDDITSVDEICKACGYLLLDAANTTGQTMQLSGGIIRR